MKKVIFEGNEVRAYSGSESPDFPKWLLNKLNGKVLKESEWLHDRISDYEDLTRLVNDGYHYILILEEKPQHRDLISMRHAFKAYEVWFEDTHYNVPYTARAIAFVSRKKH